MLAIGDLRNRMMALADESAKGNPDIYRLFSYRLSTEASPTELRAELVAMVAGTHRLVAKISEPMQRLIRTHLRYFAERMPDGFDLGVASIGNLILAGGYLFNEGDIQSVIFLFSKLVEVRGIVRPIVADNYHLAANMQHGETVFGQHCITEASSGLGRIEKLYLVKTQGDPDPVESEICDEVHELVEGADLICYPLGSFYTSLVANLLPRGVGHAIGKAPCPKIYIPNLGSDPEQRGMTVIDSVQTIIEMVRRDVQQELPIERIINLMLVDPSSDRQPSSAEREQIANMGIDLLEVPMADTGNPDRHDPLRVTEALLSLS